MRQHSILNQSRLSTAEEVAQEIERLLGCNRGVFVVTKRVKLDSWLQLVKALRKVDNLLECRTTLERVARRAKGKCTKDSDSNPSVVSGDVSEDSATGAGESATRRRSVGLNKSTLLAIHCRTRCKEIFVNGRTQRRRGKVTTSPKGKGEGKNKGKGKRKYGKGNRNQAGSLVQETGQRTLGDFGINVRELKLSVMFKKMLILRHPEWIEQLMCFAFKSARVS